MNNIEDAKELMEEGWKARENLEFEVAREKLNASLKIFEKERDFKLVTEALNHLAYTEKLDSAQHASLALETALKSEKIAIEHQIDLSLIYRAIISTAESLGNFELALKYTNKMLPLLNKPILKGDLLSHMATFEMRTGNLSKATETIEEALKLLEEGWDSEREPHRTIWKLRALSAKALIISNQGDKSEALEILSNAKRIAQENDLKPRLKQIEMLIETLN